MQSDKHTKLDLLELVQQIVEAPQQTNTLDLELHQRRPANARPKHKALILVNMPPGVHPANTELELGEPQRSPGLKAYAAVRGALLYRVFPRHW